MESLEFEGRTVQLPKDLLEEIQAQANLQGTTVSEVMRQAIYRGLNAPPRPPEAPEPDEVVERLKRELGRVTAALEDIEYTDQYSRTDMGYKVTKGLVSAAEKLVATIYRVEDQRLKRFQAEQAIANIQAAKSNKYGRTIEPFPWMPGN